MAEPTSVLEPIQVVRVNRANMEPALDMTDDELAGYVDDRAWSRLKFRSGMEPAVFTLAPLSMEFMLLAAENMRGEAAREYSAFLASFRGYQHPGEAPRMVPGDELIKADTGVRVCHSRWAEQVKSRYGLETVRELGRVALKRARLDDTQAASFGSRPGSAATG